MNTATMPPRQPLRAAVFATPRGEFTAVADGDTFVAGGFTTLADLASRLGLDALPTVVADLGVISAALGAYFDGTDVRAIDHLDVRQPGGAFRQDVWRAMRAIPAGRTMSYGELAVAAGHPSAVRAVGTACAVNLVPFVVPCHRITRAGGALGNYYYGVGTKRWLLDHEAAAVGAARPHEQLVISA